jgi:hypothetical protein
MTRKNIQYNPKPMINIIDKYRDLLTSAFWFIA